MRKLLFTIVYFISISIIVQAQEKTASVEKNIINLQFGITTIILSDEFKIADQWSLMTEIAINAKIPSNDFTVSSMISLGTRFYYNISKRHIAGKDIHNNAANFLYGRFGIYTKSDYTLRL